MKVQASRWIVGLLVILALPALAGAQEYKGKAKLKGKVVNADGQGLKDAIVTAVYADTGDGPKAVKAKGDGTFEVKKIKPGTWTITGAAGHLGYGAESLEVDVLRKDTPEITLTLQPLQALLDEANTKFKANNYDEAREAYLKILTALPDNVNVHQPIALCYQHDGQHEQALEHFDALLDGWKKQTADGTTPRNPAAEAEIKLEAASSSAEIGDYPRMHAYIDSIPGEEFTRSAVSALVEISSKALMTGQKNYEEAVSVLNLAVQRAPTSPMPYYYRGMSYVQLDKNDAATEDFGKFVELSPTETPQVKQAKEILEKLGHASGS